MRIFRRHILVTMYELPVIGFLCLRTGIWDPHGENIATRLKEMYSKRLFRRPKKESLERLSLFHRSFIRNEFG